MINLEEIIQSIKEQNYSDLSFNKMDPNIEIGDPVMLLWKDGFFDCGYCFVLPGQDFDGMREFMIHIPQPNNSNGKDSNPPDWLHSSFIMENDDILLMEKGNIIPTVWYHYIYSINDSAFKKELDDKEKERLIKFTKKIQNLK